MVENNYFAPWDFKYCISEYEEMYQGSEQHDSYEFLNKVLDFLHEDLNRVKVRPRVILKDSKGKSEKVIAKEQWDLHTLHNNSIIVDLFYGQTRAKTKWKRWNHESLKFDPYSSLSLPFPFEDEDLTEFTMVYHPYNYEAEGAVTTYKIKWSQKLTLKGLTERLKDIMGEDTNPEYFVRDAENNLESKTDKFKISKLHANQLEWFNSLDRDENVRRYTFQQSKKSKKLFLFDTIESLNSCLRIGIDPTENLAGFHYRVFKHLFSYLRIYTRDHDAIHTKKYEFEDDSLKNFYHFFIDSNKGTSLYYTIKLRNVWGAGVKWPNWDRYHKDDCDVQITEKVTLDDLLAKMYPHEPQFIIVYCNTELIDLELLTGEKTGQFTIDNKTSKNGDGASFTLQECLDAFSKQDTISGDNKWYCEGWKSHVDAVNQMTLYTLPKYLVLQLKRFRQNEFEMYSRHDYLHSKISNFVDYPVEGLDLTPYVQNEEYKSKAVYDLWGVIHHMGDMRGGHYIAMCKNPVSGQWYEFDDAHVSKVYTENIVSRTGYVLVYERRATDNQVKRITNGRIDYVEGDIDMEYIA